MNTSNRATLITKTHKVLKKHYQPVALQTDRTVLEHLLYACCLENSHHEAADEAFAKLQEFFYDWNEVRVTTIAELAEVMSCLADPARAAKRLKQTLHSVFETHYSFDVDFLRKQNLGKSVKEIERYGGATSFVVSYVTQHGLGGHAIPTCPGAINALVVLGVATPNEASKNRVPGLERAIPKSKGAEFGSLMHQLGVDYRASAFSPRVRSILLEIAPDAKDRFPKRGAKKALAKDAVGKKRVKAEAAKKKAATKTAKKAESKKSDAATKKPKKAAAKSARKATGATKKKSATKRLAKKKPR